MHVQDLSCACTKKVRADKAIDMRQTWRKIKNGEGGWGEASLFFSNNIFESRRPTSLSPHGTRRFYFHGWLLLIVFVFFA